VDASSRVIDLEARRRAPEHRLVHVPRRRASTLCSSRASSDPSARPTGLLRRVE